MILNELAEFTTLRVHRPNTGGGAQIDWLVLFLESKNVNGECPQPFSMYVGAVTEVDPRLKVHTSKYPHRPTGGVSISLILT